MRPKGSSQVLEARRVKAMRLLKQGMSLHEVARKVGCAASSVMRWRDRLHRDGPGSLKVRSSPGRPPKLTPAQRRDLVRTLLKGPLAAGYSTDLWTTRRIADLVRKRFGVRYHPDHVGRLMHQLGWTPQKPTRRALQRDEQSIREWKEREWPRIKKTPRGWAPISSSPTRAGSS